MVSLVCNDLNLTLVLSAICVSTSAMLVNHECGREPCIHLFTAGISGWDLGYSHLQRGSQSPRRNGLKQKAQQAVMGGASVDQTICTRGKKSARKPRIWAKPMSSVVSALLGSSCKSTPSQRKRLSDFAGRRSNKAPMWPFTY